MRTIRTLQLDLTCPGARHTHDLPLDGKVVGWRVGSWTPNGSSVTVLGDWDKIGEGTFVQLPDGAEIRRGVEYLTTAQGYHLVVELPESRDAFCEREDMAHLVEAIRNASRVEDIRDPQQARVSIMREYDWEETPPMEVYKNDGTYAKCDDVDCADGVILVPEPGPDPTPYVLRRIEAIGLIHQLAGAMGLRATLDRQHAR